MKKYIADETLEMVLKNHGFNDYSMFSEKKKHRKRFQLSEKAAKKIYFNKEVIELMEDFTIHESKQVLSASELKLFLLFFKLEPKDIKEFFPFPFFKLNEVEETLKALKPELEHLILYNINNSRRKDIEKVLKLYNEISIN